MTSRSSSHSGEQVHAFWSGPALSFYEELSLKSFVATGARVCLYTYEDNLPVPAGVERVDANEILPGPLHQFRYPNGDRSPALHSDLFRYTVLERFGGWYVDLDIVLLRPDLPDAKIYLVEQSKGSVNAAVAKFPARTPVMSAAIAESMRLLPQTNRGEPYASRLLIGPPLITQLARDYALDHLVLPPSKAYEIAVPELVSFFDPAACDAVQARLAASDFTHLWNEVWRWIRIPKDFGPPEGSFLDKLFRIFEIDVSPRARLSEHAIAEWFNELQIIWNIKSQLAVQTLDDASVSAVRRWSGALAGTHAEATANLARVHERAARPQTISTFWHGDAIGPYQLLCLRSFFDRGHRVEVFSYDDDLDVPAWIVRKHAADILPRDVVLGPTNQDGKSAIHSDVFRFSLLEKLGGWWVDPGVVLLAPDLPADDIFVAAPDEFGRIPTAVLKFPTGHPAIAEARRRAARAADAEPAGAPDPSLWTMIVEHPAYGLSGCCDTSLDPISWFDIAVLFDPKKADVVAQACNGHTFLQLHDDAWRRSGIPHRLAPPRGSWLDQIFGRHACGARFGGEIAFADLNRWVTHMYHSARLQALS